MAAILGLNWKEVAKSFDGDRNTTIQNVSQSSKMVQSAVGGHKIASCLGEVFESMIDKRWTF